MTPREREDWLKSLKSGDKVCKIYNRNHQILTVQKITPTGKIRTTDGTLWDKRGSWHSDWYYASLYPVTPEILAAIERKQLLSRLLNIKWDTYSTAKLKAVTEILLRVEE